MTQWFQERYIERDEHQRIVAYYKKLVAQLYGTVRDLRMQMNTPVEEGGVLATPVAPLLPATEVMVTQRYEGNVVSFEVHRRRRQPSEPV